MDQSTYVTEIIDAIQSHDHQLAYTILNRYDASGDLTHATQLVALFETAFQARRIADSLAAIHRLLDSRFPPRQDT